MKFVKMNKISVQTCKGIGLKVGQSGGICAVYGKTVDGSWRGRQNSGDVEDRRLTALDFQTRPTHAAVTPNGRIMCQSDHIMLMCHILMIMLST